MQANKPPRQAKLGDKVQTRIFRAHWKAFIGVCEVFRELVTKLESGSIIDAARESGGSDNGAAPSQIDYKLDVEWAIRKTFDETKRHEFYVWLFLNNEKGAEKYAILGKEFLRRGLYPLGRYFSSTKGFNEQSQAVKKALKTPKRKLKRIQEVQAEIVEDTPQSFEDEAVNDEILAFEHQHGFSFEDFEEAVACE